MTVERNIGRENVRKRKNNGFCISDYCINPIFSAQGWTGSGIACGAFKLFFLYWLKETCVHTVHTKIRILSIPYKFAHSEINMQKYEVNSFEHM